MDKKKEKTKAGFITKASAMYSDKFLLRAKIQLIPGIGGALDTLLSGLGGKYQFDRIEHFLGELDERLKRIETLNVIEPTEPLYDLMMQVFDQVIKTRSEEKRQLFANLVANQVLNNGIWDEAETATRLLADLADLHIKLLKIALGVPKCKGVFDNLQVFTLTVIGMPENGPTDIRHLFPELSIAVLEMACSELIAKGLLRDEGLGRFDTKSMEYFTATEMAQWLMDWIAEPETAASP